ncbi:hypothetical protein M1N59_01520 [Dehalococcoidales bacterium]|nr:hypothetical protein [Dehalococcoidales bacterium]
MVPVIRIDDEVWKQLQKRARPLIDTPNDVLRRILELNGPQSSEMENIPTAGDIGFKQGGEKVKDSIVIVVNAAGKYPDQANADKCRRLVECRIDEGVDIVSPRRFKQAKQILKKETRIAMHQGGAEKYREKNAGCLVAAGKVVEVRELTEEDKQNYSEVYGLTVKYYPGKHLDYPGKHLVGIILYEFPRGMAKSPLPKQDVGYKVGRGVNFVVISPDHPRYPALNAWWSKNF